MTIKLTDEVLAEWQAGEAKGPARAAGYLLDVPAEVRDAIVAEATVFTNMTPGYRWADGIYAVVSEYKRLGEVPTTYRSKNAAIIEREQTERDANGNRQTFYPEDVA